MSRSPQRPQSREWDRTLKPRWKIELEEAYDNQYLEGGPCQFICQRCREKSTVELMPVTRYRTHVRCPRCKASVNL